MSKNLTAHKQEHSPWSCQVFEVEIQEGDSLAVLVVRRRNQILTSDDRCSSGESGTIDFGEVIYSDKRPIFGELIDIAKFRQFKVDFDTIVWENGLDLAPEFLYNFLVKSQHAT